MGGAYIASNNGLSVIWTDPVPSPLPSGSLDMGTAWPDAAMLGAAFPGYPAASAAAAAAGQALAKLDAAIAKGAVITSTSAPPLNGTYSITKSSQSDIQAQQVSILTRNVFTNGQTSRVWYDMVGTGHTFSTTQFTAFAEAVAPLVDEIMIAYEVELGGSVGSWPSNALTIA